jgi:hypothetical protein
MLRSNFSKSAACAGCQSAVRLIQFCNLLYICRAWVGIEFPNSRTVPFLSAPIIYVRLPNSVELNLND